MDEVQPECRLCGAISTWKLGRIPESDFFAGRVLSTTLPGGWLWECHVCRSRFRHPVRSEEEYRNLYEVGVANQWEGSNDRQDWNIVLHYLAQAPTLSRVLDVGCGTGELIGFLPKDVAMFGIEPSPAAGQASKRGVTILGGSLAEIRGAPRFDAIVIVDVIEHFAHPVQILDQAFDLLLPGGRMIVSTGDPGASAWRWLPAGRFWYSSFPEHLTFPSYTFYEAWAQRRGAKGVERQVIRHQVLSPAAWFLFLVAQLAFAASPTLLNMAGLLRDTLRRVPRPRRQRYSPGVPGLFLDHHVVVVHKVEADR